MKVFMLPSLESSQGKSGGISRVIENWHKYAPDFDIQYVLSVQSCDLFVSHAGTGYISTNQWPDVAITHGLYWVNDYPLNKVHFEINGRIIDEVRHAKVTTVPSPWVAKSFQRDMRFTPYVIPHGIDFREWKHDYDNRNFVLWNKNRVGDACSPDAMMELARLNPDINFVSTFGEARDNITITGTMAHFQMKPIIQQAGVYLSTARETFCIGALEAMASGVPVLGWNFGGNRDLIDHGITGYLAEVNNMEDLCQGLRYCLQYRKELGSNAREIAREYSWEKVMVLVRQVYDKAMEKHGREMFIDEKLYRVE